MSDKIQKSLKNAVLVGLTAVTVDPPGVDGYVLTTDTSTETGLKWSSPGGGSGVGDVVGPSSAGATI